MSGAAFPYEIKKEVDTINSKIFVGMAKPTPGVNGSELEIAKLNLRALKDFSGSALTIKFDSLAAKDDSAAIQDDGVGTNVLANVFNKFTLSDPPVRTNGYPSGTLPQNTTQTNISLTTNENATCKYSTTAGVEFDSIANTFSSTGSTAHTQVITGLHSGTSYSYYVRCEDGSGSANMDDYAVSFSVAAAADTTAPIRSNGAPSGNLAAGTTQTNITLKTNENATCKYATTPNTSYNSMTQSFLGGGTTDHTAAVSGLSTGNVYNYYVRCRDTAGNVNSNDFTITFSVLDNVKPTISLTAPSAWVYGFKNCHNIGLSLRQCRRQRSAVQN